MSYVLRSNTFSVYLVLLVLTLEVKSKSLKKCLLLLFLNIHSLFFGVGRGHLNLLWLNWQSSSLSGANQKTKQNELKKKIRTLYNWTDLRHNKGNGNCGATLTDNFVCQPTGRSGSEQLSLQLLENERMSPTGNFKKTGRKSFESRALLISDMLQIQKLIRSL